MIWHVPSPSEDQLLDFEHRVQQWQAHFKLNYIQTSASQCNFDNFHKINHAADHARRNGGWASTCTSSYEKSHTLFAKIPAKHHNRKNKIEHRMLQVAMRTAFYEDEATQDHNTSSANHSDVHSCETASTSSSSRLRQSTGSVTRIRRNLTTYMYFRVKELALPPSAARTFLKELRAAYSDIISTSENAAELQAAEQLSLQEIVCWQFLKCRVNGASTEHTIRAPRGNNFTSIDCGNNSYAKVLAIIDIRNVTVLAIQWYTPVFKGSAAPIPKTSHLARTHTRLVITNKVVVIPLDHVKRVVHVVPDTTSAIGVLYVNNAPLGTAIRATNWENIMINITE